MKTRTRNAVGWEMEYRGLAVTPENIASLTRKEWLQAPNFGRAALKDVESYLSECGLSLALDDRPMVSISSWGLYPAAAKT